MSIKLSMTLLYRRMFAVNVLMNQATWLFIIFIAVFYISETCVAVAVEALCTSPPPNPPLCTDIYKNTIVQAAFNVATDFGVLALPICQVLVLHMRLSRKLGVCAIFGIGLLSVEPKLFRHSQAKLT